MITLKTMQALCSALVLLLMTDLQACSFEAELSPPVQQFLDTSTVIQEVAHDYDTVIHDSHQRGRILRNNFDASYGAADCQTQAILMMGIMNMYPQLSFARLPLKVQTTLKAMHVLTKYY